MKQKKKIEVEKFIKKENIKKTKKIDLTKLQKDKRTKGKLSEIQSFSCRHRVIETLLLDS